MVLNFFSSFFRYLILQIEATNYCNLNCKICMRSRINYPKGYLNFETFKEVLDSYNFKSVSLHGWGEPLLNPELFKMIKYAEDKGIPASITTNATLLNENTIKNIFSSNLSEIAFGIYSEERLNEVKDNIKGLIKEKRNRKSKKPKTYFDITIYADNIDEIPELINNAKKLGIDEIILHRLFNLYKVDKSVEYITRDEERKLFEKLKKIKGIPINLPKPHTIPCRIVKLSIFVTWHGKVTPCCFLPEYFIGDAKDGIKKILTSQEYKNFIKNMDNHEICGRCIW
ncbi:MAG: radical SAM protein [Candidatus Hydrothermarchaeota archaeon]|nr:MAG: radical SAM protein [Candidatus Hydrothermarchaeota archaeon]